MLQIIVNNQQVDLLTDTEVSITINQPMLSSDHIPVPYSTDIDLPLTSRNRMIFGYADRTASSSHFTTLPARILYDNIEITSGEIIVSEVEETITANYNGVVIPTNIDKMAYRQNLGKQGFGKAIIGGGSYDGEQVKANYNNYFWARTQEDFPDIVAAPISINARNAWTIPILSLPMFGIDEQKEMSESAWISRYDEMFNYYVPAYYDPSTSYINKILPAMRVGWLINQLFDGRCTKNIFDSGDWRRLMLLSMWHPRYKQADNVPVYDIDDELNTSLTWADFMPKKAANEIVAELLKLPCASIYAVGDHYAIEYNRDVMARTVAHDWTSKVIGRVSISEQEAQRYVAGYSQEDDEVSAELVPQEIGSVLPICSLNPTQDVVPATYKVSTTGQIIERTSADDASKVEFNVLQQSMSLKEEKDPDDDRGDYDMSFGGTVPKTNIALQLSTESNSQGHRWYYTPQISEAVTERQDSIVVALYYGMQREIRWNAMSFYNYPYLSHCNYDCRGNKIGDLSLSYTQPDGLAAYHADYKAWIERARRIVKCKVLLDVLDLHNLDMRDKIIYRNRKYYISSITINLTPDSIEPAEVELIEA